MDQKELRSWEHEIDVADSSPVTANLPDDAPVGSTFVDERCSDGVVRTWLRVLVAAGNVGARWAYWLGWQDAATGQPGIGPHKEYKVVADRIFNGDASHFVGLLGVPYAGKVGGPGAAPIQAWVLVSPKQQGGAVVHVKEDKRGADGLRYERSKEVFDVATGETKVLP